ncbi:MAG TPA: DUF4236 domain-containing protein [Nitrospira sp.]|jgi:hypothetical protein|nr:DUF4236 domain-containing protein [Nitrospira sp.]
MGWNWRKSINVGPLRINLTKRGIGYSAGVRGFRMGRNAKGQNYNQISIPGTGIYKRTTSGQGHKGGRTVAMVLLISLLIVLVRLLLK